MIAESISIPLPNGKTRRLVRAVCQNCKKEFHTRTDGFGKYCSKQCTGIGRRIAVRASGKGYLYVHAPGHPYADRNGQVRQHRIVMEMALGRVLRPDEDVHHKDGDITNNAIGNLEVLTKSEHRRIHSGWKRIDGEWFKTCNGCQRFLKVEDANFAKRNNHREWRSRCRDCEASQKGRYR